MKTYYIGNIPFNGEDSISHGRTKGSRNGYSTTPGYVPIGQKAGMVTDSGTGTVRRKKKSLWSTVSGAASSAARSVGRTATSAARSVGKTASKAYGNASKAAKSAYSSGKEFITGSKANDKQIKAQRHSVITSLNNRETRNAQKQRATNLHAQASIANQLNQANARELTQRSNRPNVYYDAKAVESYKEGEKNRKAYTKAADDQNKRNVQMQREMRQEERQAYNDMMKAQREYEKTYPGFKEKIKRNVKNASATSISAVSSWVSARRKNLKEFVTGLFSKPQATSASYPGLLYAVSPEKHTVTKKKN